MWKGEATGDEVFLVDIKHPANGADLSTTVSSPSKHTLSGPSTNKLNIHDIL